MEITDQMVEAALSALTEEDWLPPFAARASDLPEDAALFAADRDAAALNRESVRHVLAAALGVDQERKDR